MCGPGSLVMAKRQEKLSLLSPLRKNQVLTLGHCPPAYAVTSLLPTGSLQLPPETVQSALPA